MSEWQGLFGYHNKKVPEILPANKIVQFFLLADPIPENLQTFNSLSLLNVLTDIISDESSALHMIESSEQQSEPSSSASVHEEAHQSPRHRSQIASSSRQQQREEQQRIHVSLNSPCFFTILTILVLNLSVK